MSRTLSASEAPTVKQIGLSFDWPVEGFKHLGSHRHWRVIHGGREAISSASLTTLPPDSIPLKCFKPAEKGHDHCCRACGVFPGHGFFRIMADAVLAAHE
ncbi:MAG: hypothetical protein ACI8PT_003206 [Gammaproteobacteria bacterium]